MVPCYYLVNFGCFICMNMLFYIFFGTNLLTQCQVPVSIFSVFLAHFQTESKWNETLRWFFGPKETPEALGEGQMSHEGVTSPHANPPGGGAQACDLLVGPTDAIPPPQIPINSETPKKKPRSGVPPPQASVATKNQSGACFSTLAEGESISGGHLHHPGDLHDKEGVVLPRGWGYVRVAMCLISLSLVFLRCLDLNVPWALLL